MRLVLPAFAFENTSQKRTISGTLLYMKKRPAKRWRIGRLVVIRYPLHNETLVGVIFAYEHGYRRTVEVMVGRTNYVFYFPK